jgi:hypothetical protein
VKEIRIDFAPIVQRLARSLATQHGAELTDESKDYLEREFGVPRRLLTSNTLEQAGGAGGPPALEHIESQLVDIPPISQDFRNLIQYLD